MVGFYSFLVHFLWVYNSELVRVKLLTDVKDSQIFICVTKQIKSSKQKGQYKKTLLSILTFLFLTLKTHVQSLSFYWLKNLFGYGWKEKRLPHKNT